MRNGSSGTIAPYRFPLPAAVEARNDELFAKIQRHDESDNDLRASEVVARVSEISPNGPHIQILVFRVVLGICAHHDPEPKHLAIIWCLAKNHT